ncbi:MAG: hypothetical protein CTY15_03340 [Methylocystis sp.]|nr:MAG: hypothetical protein CTY15_03340 [Methylocystis sp.]
MRHLRVPLTLAILAGFFGASLATPAAADGWGWGGHHGWGRQGWGGGHWDRGAHWNGGGAAAAAALGGFALGAVAGAASQPGYGGGYGDCYAVDRPVTDDWGQVIEYRRTQVCD